MIVPCSRIVCYIYFLVIVSAKCVEGGGLSTHFHTISVLHHVILSFSKKALFLAEILYPNRYATTNNMLSKTLVPTCSAAAGSAVFFNGHMMPFSVFSDYVNESAQLHHKTQQPASSSSSSSEDIIYEVVRWRNKRPCWSDQHAMRMLAALVKFRHFVPKESVATADTVAAAAAGEWKEYFSRVLYTVAERNNLTEQNIKVVAWRDDDVFKRRFGDDGIPQFKFASSCGDGARFNLLAFPIKSFYPPEQWYKSATADVAVMAAARHDPHSKIPHPDIRSKAEQLQLDHGVFECILMRPTDGVLTEGSRSNFVLIQRAQSEAQQDGDDVENAESKKKKEEEEEESAFNKFKIVQALDEDVLLGITRETVNHICAKHNIKMEKRNISQRDIESDQTVAMALTGTSLGVLPVRNVVTFDENGAKRVRRLSGEGGAGANPLLAELQRLYVAYRDGEMKF